MIDRDTAWNRAWPPGPWMGRARTRRVTLVYALLFVICAPADLLLLRHGAEEAAWGVMVIGLLCAVALAVAAIRAETERHARMMEAERLHADAFQHAITSIWVEDWSEVGRTVLALRRSGVSVADHLAGDPALKQALYGSVRILDVNDATVALLGAADKGALIGRLMDVVPASIHTFDNWLAALARGDRAYRAESRVRHCGGQVRDCLVMASLPSDQAGFGRILVSILDITDYKADQARLARAERDAARVSRLLTVGVLTGSIAHEVNNPLAATITNAEAAMRWLGRHQPDVPEAVAAIAGAIEAARRAQDVVDRTRRLVTRGTLDAVVLDVAALIRTAVAMVDREIRDAAVEVLTQVDPGTPQVVADPVRVQQILINLLQNAVRAIEAADGPHIVTLSAAAHASGACITVTDTGVGVPPALRDRLFEPFATTRPDGMGLGLAVCKASVEALGGRLWLEDGPGSGTSFRFTLPAAVRP